MALEQTSNWQERVDITAAKIALKITPAIHGLNSKVVSAIKMRSLLPPKALTWSGWLPK